MIGLLVLFVQDIGDIWLELSKTVLYFKDRGGKEHWGPEMGANFCFAIFTLQQWVIIKSLHVMDNEALSCKILGVPASYVHVLESSNVMVQ